MNTPYIAVERASIAKIINKYKELGEIFYPVKANAYKPLLHFIYEQGCCFNVNSLLYLNSLLELGIPKEKILWDNCLSTISELDYVISHDIQSFCVDSIELYNYISNKSKKAKFFIKISKRTNETPYKFGSEHFKTLYKCIKKRKVLLGVSFYLGYEYFNENNFVSLVNMAISEGPIEYLNIGGGFDNFFNYPKLVEYIKYIKRRRLINKIIFEPGRSILNYSSKIYSTVINVRRINNQNWIRIDASIYSGMIDRYIENKEYRILDSSSQTTNYYVAGFTSDCADYFGEHGLSSTLKCGDIITISDCGAYCFDMSCSYSGAKKLNVRMI